MNVLIFGASGLLGSHLAAAAMSDGHDVVAQSRNGEKSNRSSLRVTSKPSEVSGVS